MITVSGLLSSALKPQQQTRPVPVASGRNGPEVVQKGAKRSTFVERKAKQEEPLQEFSIPKYVSLASCSERFGSYI